MADIHGHYWPEFPYFDLYISSLKFCKMGSGKKHYNIARNNTKSYTPPKLLVIQRIICCFKGLVETTGE